jgi:hypothetical protein
LIADGTKVKTFWQSYGLLPVLPFANDEFNLLTIGAMWLGIFSFAAIFFLTSTVASKVTIEQLRGDVFFSVGDAISFIKEKWKTVFGTFIVLLLITLFLLLIPVSISLLGKIPYIGTPILILASLFMPIAFLLGLLIAFITAVFICSLFFVPAIIATTGADAFETIFQLFFHFMESTLAAHWLWLTFISSETYTCANLGSLLYCRVFDSRTTNTQSTSDRYRIFYRTRQ